MAKKKRALALVAGGAIVAGALFGVFLLVTAGSAAAKEFATLRVIEGTVQVREAGASGFATAEDRQSLHEGDTVRTGPDGRAEIDYFDGSISRLDFSSTFHVEKLETLRNAARSKVIVGKQPTGSSYNRITKLTDSQSRVQVVTPTATASVQGTVFAVEVNPDGSTTIIVLEGVVAVQTPHGVVLVKTGQKVTVVDGTPGAVTEATAEDLANDAWIQFNNDCDTGADPNCAALFGGSLEPSPSPSATSTESPSPAPSGSPAASPSPSQSPSSPGGGGPPAPDTTPPNTAISSGPTGTVAKRTATFGFVSSESNSTFECSLDSAAFSSCSAPTVVSGLDDGAHNFRVRAIDAANNVDPSPASRDWTVDTTPPAAPEISSHPDAITNQTSATFTFGPGSLGDVRRIPDLGYLCSLDGAVFTTCSSGVTYHGLSDGAHTFQVEAVDEVANQSAPASFAWTVDTAPPTIAVSHTADGSNGWNVSSPVTEHVTASDGSGSGLDGSPSCTVDSSPAGALAGSGPWTFGVSGVGSHAVSCSVSDLAGNSNSNSDTVKIDTTDPAIHISHTSDGSNGWDVTSPVTETVSASDGGSGLDGSPACTVDSSPGTLSGSGPWTFSVSSDGSHSVECSVHDLAGNHNSDSETVKIDTTNPAITVSHTADGSNGWNVTAPVTETVTSSDSGSGLDGAPSCTVDSSPASLTGTGPWTFDVTGAGSHSVSCSVSDLAGNSNSDSETVTIDTTNPSIHVSHTADGSNGWNLSSPVTETVTASDGGSGLDGAPACTVDEVPATLSGSGPWTFSVSSDGSHSVNCSVSDLAGNSNSDSETVKIDTTDPSITVSHTADGSNDWNVNSPVTETVTASDGGSGLDGSPSCTVDEVPATLSGSGPWTFSVSSDGSHSVNCSVSDLAGNSNSDSETVKIDTTNPAITVSHTADGSNGWNVTSPVTETVTASDGGSGLDGSPSCTVDDSPATLTAGSSGTWTFSVSSDGSHDVSCSISDLAGNSNSDSETVKIDTADPSITVSHTADGSNGWNVTSPVTETVTASDGGSGLDGAPACTVDEVPATLSGSGPWTFSVSSDGSHSVECSVNDQVGHSNSDSETVKIDTTDPSITVSHTADGSNGWNITSPVTETVTASDGGSGLDGAPSCTVDSVPATLSGSGPWTFSVSSDGSHSVECSVNDLAGNSNSDSETVKIDTTDPSIHVSHTADGSNDWNVTSPVTETVTASDGGSGLDGAPACTVDSVLATLSGSGPWTFSVSGDGSHSVECSVSDKAGNSNSDSDTVKIDTTPPDTSITAHPNNPTNQTSASFSFTSTEANSTFQCKLDTGAFSDCTSPKTYSSLADGSHTFQVEATDQAGNTDATPATFTWTINTTKPTLAFVAKPNNPTNDNTPKFEVETSPHESATWECYLEPVESAFNSCAAGSSFHLVKSYNTALSDGTYTFHVRAMDLLGNTSDELTYTFAVDTVAPDTSIGAKPSNPSTSTSATFSFSATDPSPSGGGFTFQCRLDSTRAGDFSACTNPKTYTGLAAGSHTFYVRAVDTAGNIDSTPASYTWTITSG